MTSVETAPFSRTNGHAPRPERTSAATNTAPRPEGVLDWAEDWNPAELVKALRLRDEAYTPITSPGNKSDVIGHALQLGNAARSTLLFLHPGDKLIKLIHIDSSNHRPVNDDFIVDAPPYVSQWDESGLATVISFRTADSQVNVHSNDYYEVLPLPIESSTPFETRPYVKFTDREMDVLRLLQIGETARQIGFDLNISEFTARAHTKNIFAKLVDYDVRDAMQAVAFGMAYGILEIPKPEDSVGEVINPLVPRERKVLEMYARGGSTESIKKDLKITTHTVRAHLKNVAAKLGTHSREESVYQALKRGYITLPQTPELEAQPIPTL